MKCYHENIEGHTFSNEFQKKLPEEDHYKWLKSKEGIFVVVADGITRDPSNSPINLSKLPKSDNPMEFKPFLDQYPSLSPAKIAASLLCQEAYDYMKRGIRGDLLIEAAKQGNYAIRDWNNQNMLNPNYLDRDLAGCVAVMSTIKDNKLNYIFNSDCGLAIYGKKGNFISITPDIMAEKEKFMGYSERKLDWSNPKDRAKIRRDFRNKLKFIGGECISYGAFTGEPIATDKNLLKRGSKILDNGSVVVSFTDGARNYFDPAINNGEIEKVLRKGGISELEGYVNSGKYDKRERTYVAVKLP